MPRQLEITDLECRYGDHTVIDGLTLAIERGDIACLLGPSGCGKTTVLRAIAGFEPVQRGEITLKGAVVSRPGRLTAPEKRRLGMVFQDYALFPHLNVHDNVIFGLRGRSKAEQRRVAGELLEVIGLSGAERRYPHELSGGQQQRVALARALAVNPDLILLDEPFSNLDVELRERLGKEVGELLRSRHITALLVTHDQQEAFALGDRVGIMKDGRLIQWDTPFNLYHQPANRFVAGFIGNGVFVKGMLTAANAVQTDFGALRGRQAYPWPVGTAVDVLLRPDDIVPDPEGELRAEIVQKAFKGAEILYTLKLATGIHLLSLFPSHRDHAVGEQVRLRVCAEHVVAFAAE
ncbi:MAG: ABC transporter ATP-binding protein [Gammaproteobacteria bacterium]|nr:ABC transporter ATP-binding protein [Gammaproteobacteria bacterium]